MFKKAPKFLWIIMFALATVTFSCNKHDDDDDDGGNGGGGGIWNPTIIDGRLPGLFSVSQDQQVQFSQGNLQYRASTNTWRFAEHQWDYVGSQKSSFVGEVDGVSIIWENIGGTVSGSDNSEVSPTYNGWIDLFGWGTSGYNGKNPYMTSTSNIDYGNGENNIAGTNYDWGVYNAISNGGNRKNYWRTLTHEEWKYLFEMRTTPSGIRFAKAKVNDVGGIILLPDDWNASTYSLNNTNTDTSEAYFDDNTISASQWTTLENAGAVFLPAAGWRSESLVLPVYGFKGVSDFSIPCCGYYWLASGNPYAARGVLFLEGGLHKCKGIADFDRSAGLSVRLVHSTQNNNDNHIEVTTNNVTDITQTTAVCGGNVTITGNGTVTARGVCWSTNSNPTVNDNHTSNGTGTGNFTSSITGLTPNTTYYVRAYATNNAGTVYGAQKSFSTTALSTAPSIVTNNVTNITQDAAICGGNVTSDGGSPVTARGVCWSTIPNPTINDNHTYNGTGTGNFTSSITGLTQSTTYYVRAFATNSIGTGYGEQISFTTTMPPGPTGAINGLFSVSPTKKVYFSQGNLQYQASTNTWRFAENQWDFVGIGNNNISSYYNGWIDLFGWGTSGWNCNNTYYQPWDWDANNTNGLLFGPPGSYNLTDNYANSDWGVYNVINNGGSSIGQWRTLTNDEWYYILNSRSGIRYAKATVNGIRGIVIFPDEWNNYTPSYANHYEVDFSWNSYSSVQWDWMEQQGAVFICAAGQRTGNSIKYIGVRGYYWSSTHGGTHGAKGFHFDQETLGANSMFIRCDGASVRLVRNAQ